MQSHKYAGGFALNAFGFERGTALDTIANLGVTLLLFTICLKLEIRSMLRPEGWGLAILRIIGLSLILSTILFVLKLAGLAMVTELGWTAMVMLGFALSFSNLCLLPACMITEPLVSDRVRRLACYPANAWPG